MIRPYERSCAERTIVRLYQRMGMPARPNIVWCQSPLQLVMIPTLLPALVSSAGTEYGASAGKRTGVAQLSSRRVDLHILANSAASLDLPSEPGRQLWGKLWERLQAAVDSIRWSGNSVELGAAIIPEHDELSGLSGISLHSEAGDILFADLRQRLSGGDRALDSRMGKSALLSQFYQAIMAQAPEFPSGSWQLAEAFKACLLQLYCAATAEAGKKVVRASRHCQNADAERLLSYSFMMNNLGFLIDNIQFIGLSNQGCAAIFFRNICFVLERPSFLVSDELRRPHSETGPALMFEDGYEIYSLEGTLVNRDWIEDPHWLSVERIYHESNQEMRRLMLKHYGIEQFLQDSDACQVARDECGVLYRKELEDEEPIAYVKVINSTPEVDGSSRVYFLRVPPYVSSAREGVAWTFGMLEEQYGPACQS